MNIENQSFTNISLPDLLNTQNRIAKHIIKTPLIENQHLNQMANRRILLKMDNIQVTGSFKARGVFNAILHYQEKNGAFPRKIVAQSSGNHAQALAFACNKFGIEALIYMAKLVPQFKVDATKKLGANVIICNTRAEANYLAYQKINDGYLFLHPSDNEDIILGQSTATLEAINQAKELDPQAIEAVFVPCGGGGLLSGAFLANKFFSKTTKTFGCEPLNANDAKISITEGKIFHFSDSPDTIADGARTLAISERCFFYLKQIEDIIETTEQEIVYWQQLLQNLLNCKIEPTSALSVAGLFQYIKSGKSQESSQPLLAIISGGNL